MTEKSFDSFFNQATGTAPYEYQRAFAESRRLPDLLEAPTGSGKTATAVLGWLWRRRHGSPEQRAEAGRRTLVEQTEQSVRRWREKLHIGDESLGMHVLMGGAVNDAWDEHPERDAILVGTQDQLLSRALMRGYGMSRYRWPIHFALLHNDCTWVMDEVQLMGVGASTAAQLQAFRERFGIAGSARTVWMTATLDEGRLRTVDVSRELIQQPFTPENRLNARLGAKKTLIKATAPSGKKGTLGPLAKEIAAVHEPGTLTLAARKAFEAMNIKTYEFQSEWARNLIAQGEAKGKAEGEARGKAEGEARGKAEGEATAILRILQARNIAVAPQIRDQITACIDLATLERWIQRAVVAASAIDVVRDDS